MSEELIIELAQVTIRTVGLVTAPMIIAIVVVGILSNVVQTVTQIRDPALAFVPKAFATGVILVISVPWMLQVLQGYTENIFTLIAGVVN